MKTVDELLIELEKIGIAKLDKDMPARDKKILASLAKQIKYGHFLTENQGKLLVKIFKENKKFLGCFPDEIFLSLEDPVWSQSFRVIEQIRKMYITKDHEGQILVEFTYNKKIKQLMSDLSRNLQGNLISVTNKQYSVPLTEKNLYLLVKNLQPNKFIIDQNILKFYQEIEEILNNKENPFNIFSVKNEKMLQPLQEEIGEISNNNHLLLNDRKIRFQYDFTSPNLDNSLQSFIANRSRTRLWINSTQHTLTDVIGSLRDLKRFPMLIIFNGHESKECIEKLKNLQESLSNLNIRDNIGIYFRFDNNTDANKLFNSKVGEIGYNKNLDNDTLVAGIANNKLPKFLIKNDWYPRSVISFSNNFRNNKTSVYCDSVDLIVYYNDKKPIVGEVDAFM